MFNLSKIQIQNHHPDIQTYSFFKSNHHIKFMIYINKIHKELNKMIDIKSYYLSKLKNHVYLSNPNPFSNQFIVRVRQNILVQIHMQNIL